SWIDRRAGAIQPLAYVRGLAKATLAAGATIYGRTRATHLARRAGRWIVGTRGGARVSAERVVMCANAYTDDLWPGVRRSIIAPNSYQISTEPLSEPVAKSILPFSQASSDYRKPLLYCRV